MGPLIRSSSGFPSPFEQNLNHIAFHSLQGPAVCTHSSVVSSPHLCCLLFSPVPTASSMFFGILLSQGLCTCSSLCSSYFSCVCFHDSYHSFILHVCIGQLPLCQVLCREGGTQLGVGSLNQNST